MESKKLEIIVFSALFIGLSVLTFLVFQPFLGILVIAIVLSVLFHPLYVRLTKASPRSKGFFAFILVIIALVFLIIPTLFLGLQILQQAQNFFALTQIGQSQYVMAIQHNIDVLIQHIVPNFSFSLSDSIDKAIAFVSNNLGGVLSQTVYIFFQTFFLLFAFFFFLRDGEKMLNSFVSLSPFDKDRNEEIIDTVYQTITSVIRGTLFVGLIRFALIAIAFYLFGIPNALLWGTLAGIIGAIPGLGTPFAIIPAFLYLLVSAHVPFALGMALFGFFIFFFVDNLLSAYFFGKGLDVPSIFILFSILGGIIFFGPLGFVFGPIILSLFISVVDTYKILALKHH